MNISRSILLTGLALAAGLATAHPSQASVVASDFSFTLDNPSVVVPAGGSAIITGTFLFSSGMAQKITSVTLSDSSGEKLTNFSLDPNFTNYLNLGGIPTASAYSGPVFDLTAASANTADANLYGSPPVSPSSGDSLTVSDARGTVTVFAKPTAGPAAVPEASTTVSFGLLLAMGLGGFVIARKRKVGNTSA